MRRRSASLVVLLSLFVFAACSAPPVAPIDGDEGDGDPVAALERDTGAPWRIRYHADGTPAFLEGRTAPLAATPRDAARAARAFLKQHRALFSMTDPDHELDLTAAEADELGMIHVRFAQQRGTVPVWGGELAVHFDRDGAIIRVHGRYRPGTTPSLVPYLSANEARVAAVLDARAAYPRVDPGLISTLTPKLWLLPRSAGLLAVVWRVPVNAVDPSEPLRLDSFVDAQEGGVVQRTNRIAYAEGSGVGGSGARRPLEITWRRDSWWLEDSTRGAPPLKTYSAGGRARLPGSQVKSADPNLWDQVVSGAGAAVDAHAWLGTTYDYFFQVHGRAGWDGQGKGPRAVVHYGSGFSNAFYDGRQLVFGDGDGATWSPLSGALDLVAHEYAHGVIEETAGLVPEGESGALAEALSDIFACFLSTRAQQRLDWQIGETVHHPGGLGRPIRDLVWPRLTGNPSSLEEYLPTEEDNGGVHLNSTIVSHAAFLMTQGGRHERSGVRVAALGQTAAERIWFRALTRYLTSHSGFADAADATLAAARDLGHEDAPQVRAAWVAVGVLAE